MITKAFIVRQFHKAIEDALDEGWKEYAKSVSDQIATSNKRMLKLLSAIKGQPFVDDLTTLFFLADGGKIRVSRSPKGVQFPERRFPTIPFIWLDSSPACSTKRLYVQVKPNRWVYVSYSNLM